MEEKGVAAFGERNEEEGNVESNTYGNYYSGKHQMVRKIANWWERVQALPNLLLFHVIIQVLDQFMSYHGLGGGGKAEKLALNRISR